jgi:carbamoyltransferase
LQAIDWNARLGPKLLPVGEIPAGWSVASCTPQELARLLHTTGEPIVVLHGRAELGPRALGARSILAPATDPAMKERLNDAKRRESYRPVAPICLEEHAPEVFDPGTPDPYMLFEHWMRPGWAERVPAVVHLDGTARLQTVSDREDPNLTAILREYHRVSGIPVLCNTSANHNGHGFFPDVASAVGWGRVDRVWSEGTLYHRVDGTAG